MTKRYRVEKYKNDLVEDPEGPYVKWSDVEATIDANSELRKNNVSLCKELETKRKTETNVVNKIDDLIEFLENQNLTDKSYLDNIVINDIRDKSKKTD